MTSYYSFQCITSFSHKYNIPNYDNESVVYLRAKNYLIDDTTIREMSRLKIKIKNKVSLQTNST